MTPPKKLLKELNPIAAAAHDRNGKPSECLLGARKSILANINIWFDAGVDSAPVYWLKDIAGVGKTTISQSICTLLEDHLGGAFFFSRNKIDCQRPSNVVPTIVHQIAMSSVGRPFRSDIYASIRDNPQISTKTVAKQVEVLIGSGLKNQGPDSPLFLIVLDALDECTKEDGCEGGLLVPLLVQHICTLPLKAKIFITSRPEPSIQTMIEKLRHPMLPPGGSATEQIQPFILHDVDKSVVGADIECYLRYMLGRIARMPAGRPTMEDVWSIAQSVDCLFIYAATAVKYISQGSSPKRNLEVFISSHKHDASKPYGALDSVYLQIIRGVIEGDDPGAAKDTCAVFRHVIGAIVIARRPLSKLALSRILREDVDDVDSVVEPLRFLLDVGTDDGSPIRIFHPSFPNSLQSTDRCSDDDFFIDSDHWNCLLALWCLELMNNSLEKNICRIENAGWLNSEIPDLDDRVKRYVPDELSYACMYWATHLSFKTMLANSTGQKLKDALYKFCREHLLHWLEVLSLLASPRSAVEGTTQAMAWLRISKLCSWFEVS
jgi:hypothetical protein